ncbi:hypothetical protein COCON_G00084050 [Conger conger]|uniref:OCA domain-containing protein n=1 Tax=Conger conger TaxID=82655 RepID=A0A9Q1I2V1_CONCO|nr:POU class 2 homeobox associating-factor 2-like [Conger conger]KAJ8276653.1 hypothetical protein COCON_G00084050 [Conger conger]
METEYSKRVYQGVRVKHTVKDLLAEKRSRQTSGPRYNGGMSPPQAAFVQMPGYPSYMDGHYAEALGDYRTTTFPTGGRELFPPSVLPSILPPFSGDSSHFLMRDSWEQNTTDTVTQTEVLCSDALTAAPAPPLAPAPPTLFITESGSITTDRASARNSALASSQPYTLHSLNEAHYPTPYPTTTSYMPCTSYMAIPGDLTPRMAPLSTEDSERAPVPSNTLNWAKDDGSSCWPPYEIRRVY